ncbi:Fe-S cluster assembly protein HesB [Mycobacterium sp. CSUR Q5927]|nr:Fe-S cluster assembly protein HesB [Mycobacterium sp. CSUR Q5927]
MPKLQLVGDPDADALLSTDPFALLVGMLLDQQIPMEVAFAGPKKIADRMGGLDPHEIAGRDPEEFAALCAERPAVHRFPGSMAGRVQALAQAIVDQYGGDTAALWTAGEPDGAQVYQRLKALPGFGEQKARIFVALLGKQYGVTPPGWREAAGAYGGVDTRLSIADVVDAASLQQVRSTKKAQKQAAKQARESGKAAT